MRTPATSTERQLLRGIRRGDFAALVALVDRCQETGTRPKVVKYWGRMVDAAVWSLERQEAGRLRMGPRENVSRWVRDFLVLINNECWARWLLPVGDAGWRPNVMRWAVTARTQRLREALWGWVTTLADGVLAHAREVRRANADKGDES